MRSSAATSSRARRVVRPTALAQGTGNVPGHVRCVATRSREEAAALPAGVFRRRLQKLTRSRLVGVASEQVGGGHCRRPLQAISGVMSTGPIEAVRRSHRPARSRHRYPVLCPPAPLKRCTASLHHGGGPAISGVMSTGPIEATVQDTLPSPAPYCDIRCYVRRPH